jgi:FtsP/CotA-like multicopper oxidase with cupredoxin domain
VPGPELRAKLGERLRIVFTNRLAEATTIHWHGVDVPNAMDGVPDVTQRAVHLHGQSFRVLAINGAPADSPLVKDSIDVDGHMGSAVVEFTAHNPGDWLLHCHKPMHMDGGMISLVKIG